MSAKDFYAADDDFSDDPEDSFYSTNDEDLDAPNHPTRNRKVKTLWWGFTWWEILILIIEVVLLVYTILIIIGVVDIF